MSPDESDMLLLMRSHEILSPDTFRVELELEAKIDASMGAALKRLVQSKFAKQMVTPSVTDGRSDQLRIEQNRRHTRSRKCGKFHQLSAAPLGIAPPEIGCPAGGTVIPATPRPLEYHSDSFWTPL
jgi:hypothetical protein